MGESHSAKYKQKGPDAQERRREALLEEQDRKRDKLLDQHRQIIETLSYDLDKQRRLKRRQEGRDIAKVLMLSEWLARPPEDLESSWMFMVCPEGRRCVVYAHSGKTVAVSKRGKQFAVWETPLPGGNAGKGSNSTTILDCIFSNAASSFYVLDVLHWGDLPLVGTEMSFRQFWIKSRLQDELPELTNARSAGRFPLIPLEVYPCSKDQLEVNLNHYPAFPDNVPKVDGILFYHREAHYTQGTTPLVGWLKPFMVPEVLGTSISGDYFADRPSDYESFLSYMAQFDEDYLKKRGKWRKGGKEMNLDDSSSTMAEGDDSTSTMVDGDDEGDSERKLVQVEMDG